MKFAFFYLNSSIPNTFFLSCPLIFKKKCIHKLHMPCKSNSVICFYVCAYIYIGHSSRWNRQLMLLLCGQWQSLLKIQEWWRKSKQKLEVVLEGSQMCREFNQNPNLWETKEIEKTHTKEKNNHTHKTIFTWFGNLPTSTELQKFHYYQGRIQSTKLRLQSFFSLSCGCSLG